MFEHKYNNCSIVGAEAAGIVYKRAKCTNGFGQYVLKFRCFLKEYQAAYKAGLPLPEIPDALNFYLKKLRFKFRLETDNIENMIKAAYRLKLPQHKNNKPKTKPNKRTTNCRNSRRNRR